jgi:predicted DNA-binding transcriptional regulator AlpA
MPDHELLLIFSKSVPSLFGAGKQANPTFPKSIRLSERVTVYDAAEIRSWLEAKKQLTPGVKTMKLNNSGLIASGQTHAEKSDPLIIISKHLSGESDA